MQRSCPTARQARAPHWGRLEGPGTQHECTRRPDSSTRKLFCFSHVLVSWLLQGISKSFRRTKHERISKTVLWWWIVWSESFLKSCWQMRELNTFHIAHLMHHQREKKIALDTKTAFSLTFQMNKTLHVVLTSLEVARQSWPKNMDCPQHPAMCSKHIHWFDARFCLGLGHGTFSFVHSLHQKLNAVNIVQSSISPSAPSLCDVKTETSIVWPSCSHSSFHPKWHSC